MLSWGHASSTLRLSSLDPTMSCVPFLSGLFWPRFAILFNTPPAGTYNGGQSFARTPGGPRE